MLSVHVGLLGALMATTRVPLARALASPLAPTRALTGPRAPTPRALAPLEPAADCFRPTADDVDRISWGRPAKRKGTGSRGVPHRLDESERLLFDFARRKGFVEIGGSGWRKERSASPLVNTYRSWCDARGKPAIFVHKGREGADEVCVDLSPLRTPLDFGGAAAQLVADEAGGELELEAAAAELPELAKAFATEPIYRLPAMAVAWRLPRAEAKALAKRLAAGLGTAAATGDGRAKARGAPRVKPGKSRRSGGYGIG